MRFWGLATVLMALVVLLSVNANAAVIELSDISDTYVDGSLILGGNNTNHGSETIFKGTANGHLWADSLIKANNIFGSNPGQLAPDAQISSAYLHMWLDLSWAKEGNLYNLHQITTDWDENTVTSNTFGRVPSNALATLVDSISGPETNPYTANTEYVFNVTSSLLDWQSGTANYGWGLTTNSARNEFFSSEYSNEDLRPYLVINYEEAGTGGVPEPCTMLLIGTGILGLCGLRRKSSV